jgi:hypothetical protein
MGIEMNFKIAGRHESHNGTAVVVENYNEGTIYIENNLPGEVGKLTTRKIGVCDGFAIYENYYDSGSDDYSYFAIAVEN